MYKKRFKVTKIILICVFAFIGVNLPVFSQFFDSFDSFNTGLFHKADGWTNGNPFNCYWRASCVTFNNSIMSITLDRDSGPLPYKSGEYRTNQNYKYGLFEVRMKNVRASGVDTDFFIYTGPSEDNPWDEIDFEFLSKDPYTVQLNYYTNGKGGHEKIIQLGFDSSLAFHTYAFDWQPNYIKWYVDGVLVHTEDGSHGALPTTACKVMMSIWPGIGVDAWLGPFSGNVPLVAQYDWVRYTPGGLTPPPPTWTPPPTATPTVKPTATPTSTIMLGDVNNNNAIDIIDALLVAQYTVGLNPSNFYPAAADVTKDGKIDIVDALRIAQYSVGIITGF